MLPKQQRLRSSREFRRVYTRGRSCVHPLCVLYVLPTGGEGRRVGFSVSKKLGKAVVRNTVKRRLREVCRLRMEALRPGFDAVFVARVPAQGAPLAALQQAADDLFRRARLLADGPTMEETPCGDSAPS